MSNKIYMFNIHKDLSILPIYQERYSVVYKEMVNDGTVKDSQIKDEQNDGQSGDDGNN